jgi:hypothetical protein
MMDVHKKQRQVIDLFSASRRFGRHHKNVDEIQKVNKNRVIQFFELLFPIKVLRVETSDLLTLQRSDDGVVVGEIVAKTELQELKQLPAKV